MALTIAGRIPARARHGTTLGPAPCPRPWPSPGGRQWRCTGTAAPEHLGRSFACRPRGDPAADTLIELDPKGPLPALHAGMVAAMWITAGIEDLDANQAFGDFMTKLHGMDTIFTFTAMLEHRQLPTNNPSAVVGALEGEMFEALRRGSPSEIRSAAIAAFRMGLLADRYTGANVERSQRLALLAQRLGLDGLRLRTVAAAIPDDCSDLPAHLAAVVASQGESLAMLPGLPIPTPIYSSSGLIDRLRGRWIELENAVLIPRQIIEAEATVARLAAF